MISPSFISLDVHVHFPSIVIIIHKPYIKKKYTTRVIIQVNVNYSILPLPRVNAPAANPTPRAPWLSPTAMHPSKPDPHRAANDISLKGIDMQIRAPCTNPAAAPPNTDMTARSRI